MKIEVNFYFLPAVGYKENSHTKKNKTTMENVVAKFFPLDYLRKHVLV
jgi:hypothetical protein